MVLVLVSMLVLSVLGTSLMHVSTTEALSVSRHQDQMQAHYLAWSGANTVATYITTNPDNLPNVSTYVNQLVAAGSSDPVQLGNGLFMVDVTRNGEMIEIHAVGQVGTSTRAATLTLKEGSGWTTPEFDCAVFSHNKINMDNSSKIIGNAGTNSNVTQSIVLKNSAEIDGNVLVGPTANLGSAIDYGNSTTVSGSVSNLTEPRNYPLPPFPDFPDDLLNKGSFSLSNGTTGRIIGDGHYSNIRLHNSSTLIIELTGDTRISTDQLRLDNSSKIVLQGNGTLTLYVHDSFSIENSATLNEGGQTSSLFLYYGGTSTLSLAANSAKFFGSVYAQKSNIKIGNSGSVTGHIIAGGSGTVDIGNSGTANVRAIYAPNATINLDNSVQVKGAVIGKTVNMGNSSKVTYDTSIEDGIEIPGNASISYSLGMWK